MRLSVVIPTYNRRRALEACVESLAEQEAQGCVHEVVIVDDGSSDGTAEWLESAARRDWPFDIQTLRGPHAGPATARNLGVRACTGDLVLFTGDDCVLAPGCIEQHLRAHAEATAPRSVLGMTTWLPSLTITPFMHYQENGGSQFAYGRIHDPNDAGWLYYYTTNVSTPRMSLGPRPFDERFPAARYEDLELGYRLHDDGLPIVYRQEALAWHDHPITFQEFRARCGMYGEYAALFHELHPHDETLANLLGIRDAEAADQVFGPGLAVAEKLVASIEEDLGDAPVTAFGVRGTSALLHDAYRLLIHHALLCGIRKAMSLPEPVDTTRSRAPERHPAAFAGGAVRSV